MEHNNHLTKIRLAKWLFIFYVLTGFVLPKVVDFFLSSGNFPLTVYRFFGYLYILSSLFFLGATWTLKSWFKENEKMVFIYWMAGGAFLLLSFILSRFSINWETAFIIVNGLAIIHFALLFLGLDLLRISRQTDAMDTLMSITILRILIIIVTWSSPMVVNTLYYAFILNTIAIIIGIYMIVGFVKIFKQLKYESPNNTSTEKITLLSQRTVGFISAVSVCILFTYVLISNINLIKF